MFFCVWNEDCSCPLIERVFLMVDPLGISVIKTEKSDSWDTTWKKILVCSEGKNRVWLSTTIVPIRQLMRPWCLSPTHLPYSPHSRNSIYPQVLLTPNQFLECIAFAPLYFCALVWVIFLPARLPALALNWFLSLILVPQWDKSYLRKYKSDGDISLLKSPRCCPLPSGQSPNSLISSKKPGYTWPLSILQHHR